MANDIAPALLEKLQKALLKSLIKTKNSGTIPDYSGRQSDIRRSERTIHRGWRHISGGFSGEFVKQHPSGWANVLYIAKRTVDL